MRSVAQFTLASLLLSSARLFYEVPPIHSLFSFFFLMLFCSVFSSPLVQVVPTLDLFSFILRFVAQNREDFIHFLSYPSTPSAFGHGRGQSSVKAFELLVVASRTFDLSFRKR